MIITFISILELARLGKISAFQNEETSEIYLRVVSHLNNFDVREADGFDEDDQAKEESQKVGEDLLAADKKDSTLENNLIQ